MKLTNRLASFVLAVAVVCFSNATIAAVDMFLDIPEAPGESQDNDHAGEIDVLAWSWGAAINFDGKKGGCGIQDLGVTKWVDSASPALLMAQVQGTVFPLVTLVVRRAGAEPLEYITLEFTNVRVSSLSTGGSGGEDRLTENISLNFQSGTFTYVPQNPDGTGGEALTAAIGGC